MSTFRKFLKWWRMRNAHKEMQSVAIGMNSTVSFEKDRNILMLDYDTKEEKDVIQSIKELQEFWNLSDCYLYGTENGYHALFYYDIIPYERCRMIIEYAREVDPMYKYISRYYSHKTLRIAGKHKGDIKFKLLIPGIRVPTKEEREIGNLKKKEHKLLLLKQHISESEKEVLRKVIED